MPDYISQPSNTSKILKNYGIALKKSYGQNFLIDTNVLKKITKMADLQKEDIVLEVGSGIGSLTEILLPNVKRIVCIEIDKKLSIVFKDLFAENINKNIDLILTDALKIDYNRLHCEYGFNKFVSNLPYKIAAPLIIKIFLEADKLNEAVLTIQKDIADRILAKPGDKNYSSYSVKVSYLVHIKKIYNISRNAFIPKPNVDSTTIKIKRNPADSAIQNIYSFFTFIDACFSQRRKKLVNSIMSNDIISKNQIGFFLDLLKELGKSEDIRAQDLELADFIYLNNLLFSRKDQ